MEKNEGRSRAQAKNCNKNFSQPKKKKKQFVRKSRNLKRLKKKYTQEVLKCAVKAVNEGASRRVVSAQYGVPLATLCRKVNSAPCQTTVKPGPATVLTPEEEQKIVNVILYRARRGYPLTKDELLDSVQVYLEALGKPSPFTEGRPGRKWYASFRKRHPQVSLRTAQNFSSKRAAVTFEDLQEWFKDVGYHLEKNNLKKISGKKVWNCDESSFQLSPQLDLVLAGKGDPVVRNIFEGNEKECLTVLFIYNAEGEPGPPMVVYKYKDGIPKDIAEKLPENYSVGQSESGWMTAELFYEYITNIFLPWLKANGYGFPIVLYVDGHSSHVTIPLVIFCEANGIELIKLYPNATHLLQPSDTSFFHPLKQMWKKTVPKWKRQEKKPRVTKETFAQVMKMAVDGLSDAKSIIKNGFASCGLMPFGFSRVDTTGFHKRRKRAMKPEQISESNTSCQEMAENIQAHLETFEKNISQDLLYQFQIAAPHGHWIGDIQNKSSFDYWLKMKNPESAPKNQTAAIAQAPSSISAEIPDHRERFHDLHTESSQNEPSNVISATPTRALSEVSEIHPEGVDFLGSNSGFPDSDSMNLTPVQSTSTDGPSLKILRMETPFNQSGSDNTFPEMQDSLLVFTDNEAHHEGRYFHDLDPSAPGSAPVCQQNLNLTPVQSTTTDRPSINTLCMETSFHQSDSTNFSPEMHDLLFPCSPLLASNSTKISGQHDTILTEKILLEANANVQEEQNAPEFTKKANDLCDIGTHDENVENCQPTSAQATSNVMNESFNSAFLFPMEYLPKKRRASLELKNGAKKVCVGFGEKWLSDALEKENVKKVKDEKFQEKKRLQRQRKELAAQIRELKNEAKLLHNQELEAIDTLTKKNLYGDRLDVLAQIKQSQAKAKEILDEIKKL